MKGNKVVLIICDGLGYREATDHNAVVAARTPNLDRYGRDYPHALLSASGEAIGLPAGQMGTSEANHLVIGSGRIIYQNLTRINHAIRKGTVADNEAIIEACEHVKEFGSVLHIKGIVSDGGVHGHTDHLKELVSVAKLHGVERIFLHLFTDGRDVAPRSAKGHVEDLEKFLREQGVGRIASIGGRYWGMDRDNNDDRIEKHFLVITKGSERKFKSALELIEHSYQNGVTDEFIEPASLELDEGAAGCIEANDAVIFANFRSDRAKQLAKRTLDENLDNLKYVAMTKYDDDIDVRVAFPPEEIGNTLSEVISRHGLRQLKVTETEKFTHLTFFFNAQRYEAEKGEDRIMIPSNKDVGTHDQRPEMKADEITAKVCEALQQKEYDFIALNLTNCDMVGHSGNFEAIVSAVEVVDAALGKIVEAAKTHGYEVIITADHGNAEETFGNGQPMTAHTINPVPFYLISEKFPTISRTEGDLSDIAPTILAIMGLKAPKEMTGKSFV
ncbi:2,3-bisphosphoglycerate-independent phosphoglycerate mutase [Candidatus Falkowbacteria bacterium]|nr:2,3-bisphosphoglycerate-independent phosphoglycerate mutase [Candidatus Falkowbacteria bacterium]